MQLILPYGEEISTQIKTYVLLIFLFSICIDGTKINDCTYKLYINFIASYISINFIASYISIE